jgi:hypothetical protein
MNPPLRRREALFFEWRETEVRGRSMGATPREDDGVRGEQEPDA